MVLLLIYHMWFIFIFLPSNCSQRRCLFVFIPVFSQYPVLLKRRNFGWMMNELLYLLLTDLWRIKWNHRCNKGSRVCDTEKALDSMVFTFDDYIKILYALETFLRQIPTSPGSVSDDLILPFFPEFPLPLKSVLLQSNKKLPSILNLSLLCPFSSMSENTILLLRKILSKFWLNSSCRLTDTILWKCMPQSTYKEDAY